VEPGARVCEEGRCKNLVDRNDTQFVTVCLLFAILYIFGALGLEMGLLFICLALLGISRLHDLWL